MKKRRKGPDAICRLSFALPMGTRLQLDYLVELYEAYRPQVEGLRFSRVTRARIVRMALAHLYHSAQCGIVGPELLARGGQDRRAGRRCGPRRPAKGAEAEG